MMQLVPGVLDTAPCHFPTEDLQQQQEAFRSVSVPLSSCSQGLQSHEPISNDVLIAAWSAILRYYVGSDVISFGHVDDSVDAATRFGVCHGEITADTRLKSLCGLAQGQSGVGSAGESPWSWIKACSSLNTVVWKTGQLPSNTELQDLENTQVRHSLTW